MATKKKATKGKKSAMKVAAGAKMKRKYTRRNTTTTTSTTAPTITPGTCAGTSEDIDAAHGY